MKQNAIFSMQLITFMRVLSQLLEDKHLSHAAVQCSLQQGFSLVSYGAMLSRTYVLVGFHNPGSSILFEFIEP